MTTNENALGYVLSSSSTSIIVHIDGLENFEANKGLLQVGRYLKITEGNTDFVIAIIRSIRGTNTPEEINFKWTFEIECQPLGTLVEGKTFSRGSTLLPVPTEPVFATDKDVLNLIFASGTKFSYPLAPLSMNKAINLMVDGDGFFGKHSAIVGSTGSGKSCTVARLLQDVIGIDGGKNKHVKTQKNSHIVIFDYHAEYANAFTLHQDEAFTLNLLDVESLALPYWLMNAEELESLFIESNEANSHNQTSQFKYAVIANKIRHNPTVTNMTYDCPVYFSIREVLNYIENMNREVIGRLNNENQPKLADGTLVTSRVDMYFEKLHDFVQSSTTASAKATNGSFNGEFNRFISRLETTLADKRLKFLLDAKKMDETEHKTTDFEDIIKQFLGYLTNANVSVIDLSGIPFEVMSITISLIARLIFDFCFHYSKLRHATKEPNDVPVMIVCEEAHNYVPQSDNVAYRSSRKSIERIAKEGRKYGLSLMVVSQRPSEVSSTIFAQCNNFIALRLTNSDDQAYIRHLIPNNASTITDVLPNLAQGECIVVGDAILMPAIVKMPMPDPKPQSADIKVYTEWQKNWRHITFTQVVKRWQKEEVE